jgi:NADH-quinone oxidoreductase subunit D
MYDRAILSRFDPGSGDIILNMGPHHPSTHGVINFTVQADGEVMKRAIPEVGFLHRGIEKIAEYLPYAGFMPYTDRVEYLGAMAANHGYALAVEKLCAIEVPPRALYLRVIADELNRIASHILFLGTVSMDVGAITPFTHSIRERETINDLLEELCGARLTYNYVRIGGVSFDLTEGLAGKTQSFLDHLEKELREYHRLISNNEIFIQRLANVAIITREDALAYGLVGPNLRASGVDWDLRRDMPYAAYRDFDFEIPVGKGVHGTVGDCYDRYLQRVLEIEASIKILRQAFAKLPEGPIMPEKAPRSIKPAAGEVYTAVESMRGEIGYYVRADGGPKPVRVKIRTGSFSAMGVIEKVSRGLMVADLVALIATLDVIAPEIDR